MKNFETTPPGQGDILPKKEGASVDEAPFDLCSENDAGVRISWITDDETGFPLPIYPYTDAPPIYTRNGELYHKDPDRHHFFFPRKQFISDDLEPGGQVVRLSRTQEVRRYYHDLAHRTMAPPPLIIDPVERFNLTLLALSNYVPSTAINFNGTEPTTRELSDHEYDTLREMTRIDFGRSYSSQVGKFFIDIMINNHTDSIDDKVICDFLEAKYGKVKKDLGARILKAMSIAAADPINHKVNILKKDGQIPKGQDTPYRTIRRYTRHVRGPEEILQTHFETAA